MKKTSGKLAAILLTSAALMWHEPIAAQQTPEPPAPASDKTVQVGTDALLVQARRGYFTPAPLRNKK
jgi:hypothetical protein